jgi:hypothetical protein
MTATFRTMGVMSFGASYRSARLAAVLAAALLAGLA